MHRTAQLVKSLLALAISLAVLLAVPAALVTQVGWPLPTAWPDLETVTRFGQTGVSDTFVINTLAVIVWLAWAQLALALLVEAVAAVRRHPARTLALLPGLQPVAARLVAAIMVLSVLTQPRTSLAGTPLEATLVAATVPIGTATAEQPVTPPHQVTSAPTRPTTRVTVGVRDSWWQLAERHLGEGIRWREIRDLNIDRRVADDTVLRADTEHLEPGWQLLVPADETTPEPADGPADPADEQADELESSAQGELWEVTEGDHFWSIAETVLTTRWGRIPTATEITPYWGALVEANRAALAPPHDPDLIYPGQQFTIPTPPTDPAATPLQEAPAQPPPGDAAPPADDAGDAGPQPPRVPAEQEPAGAGGSAGSWSAALEARSETGPWTGCPSQPLPPIPVAATPPPAGGRLRSSLTVAPRPLTVAARTAASRRQIRPASRTVGSCCCPVWRPPRWRRPGCWRCSGVVAVLRCSSDLPATGSRPPPPTPPTSSAGSKPRPRPSGSSTISSGC
jgi:nucleoid-associated protein YgaU